MYGHPLAANAHAAALAPQVESVGLALQFQSTGSIPEWIELIPAGEFVGRDGRRWVNSQPDQIIAAFRANRASLPVDLEHSSELKAKLGEPAPAVGWIEDLDVRAGAVWGRIEWTEPGRELVANRQYRYYSPVIYFAKDSNQVLALKSGGLTNQPNLFIPALNRQGAHHTNEETLMTLSPAILAALSLAVTATETEVLAAINTLKSDRTTALNQAQSPDLAKFVPNETYELALNRATAAESSLAAIQAKQLDAEIETAINAALTAGKIPPANKDYFVAMCRTQDGLAQFKAFAETAPAIVPIQGEGAKQIPGDTGTALNAEEQQVAKLLGMSTTEFSTAKASASA